MDFTPKAQQQIDTLYKGRKHIELTIGILRDGKKEISRWNPDRQEASPDLVYPVGSICKPFVASLLAKYLAAGDAYIRVHHPAVYVLDNASVPSENEPGRRPLSHQSVSGYAG